MAIDPGSEGRETAKLLLTRARDAGSSATKIAVAWSFALILIWCFGLEPLRGTIDTIHRKQEQTARSIRKAKAKERALLYIRDPHRPWLAPIKRDVADRRFRDAIAHARGTLRLQEAELGRLRHTAQVPFKVPGFDFGVRPTFGCLIWSLLLTGLLAYLYAQRAEILNLTGRAIRLQPDRDPELGPMADGFPWWVAPLPHKRGETVDGARLRTELGWTRRYPAKFGTTIALLSVAVLLQLRVVFLSFVMTAALGNHFDKMWVRSTIIGFTVVSCILGLQWLGTISVPDQHPNEIGSDGISRRTALAMAATAIACVLAGPLLLKRKQLFHSQPRFRRWFPGQVEISAADILDLAAAKQLIRSGSDPIAKYLRTQWKSASALGAATAPNLAAFAMAAELSRILGKATDELEHIAEPTMKPYVKRLYSNRPVKASRMRLRRLILSDAYPKVFARPTRKRARQRFDFLYVIPSAVRPPLDLELDPTVNTRRLR